MNGLSVTPEGYVHVTGELRLRLVALGVEHVIQGNDYRAAIKYLKRECLDADSNGLVCYYSHGDNMRARCACAAALAALHDIDPSELTQEQFALIMGQEVRR